MKTKKVRIGVKIAIAVMMSGLLVPFSGFTDVTHAWVPTGAKWSTNQVSKLSYNKTGSSSVNDIWNEAIFNWNQQSTKPNFSTQTTSSPNVEFQGVHISNTDSDGKAQWYTDSNGTTYHSFAWINTYFTSGYSSLKARSVASHEIGHVLGLSHASGCVLMSDNTPTRYDTCGVYTPQSDDLNGINALY
ncbi:hypothetical protein BS614_30910 (plasmid) [Paenibacillus xylanexedens]|uniref:M57 family metalloprotease n=1 Tax=Paenibacillus xylanexedens TaxID=528191 RepID=UPI0009386A3C|nr:M57 family metalloprotease [Paenibacillus xylanexedens]APO48533.1 hypothetical protein BS614_30910 [Paenibacillus xylanexedens]